MTTEQIRAVVMIALWFGLGWFVTRMHYRAEISTIKLNYANEKRDIAEANTKALADAQTRADDAIKRLFESERNRILQSQENQREIKRLTSGRACLSGELVRLLNAAVPAGQRQAIGGAADAATGFASDTDVAEWIDTARLYYGRCQDRVNELRRFFEGGIHAGRGE